MRILAWPLIVLVRGYQWLLSPILPTSCRFDPSCSAYAVAALSRFGLVAGSFLAVRRMARCHPWGECGLDPVPETLDGLWPWKLFQKTPRAGGPGVLR